MEPPVSRSFFLAGVVLLSLCQPVRAQTPAGQTVPPAFKGRSPAEKGPPPPGANPMDWYYPDYAMRMEIDGKTVMSCEVDAEGRWQDCRVESETPAGYGFGEAALAVSRHFKMKPKLDAGGNPVMGGRITIPLTWKAP